jgi:acyl-CoA synthetase (NDP forming)
MTDTGTVGAAIRRHLDTASLAVLGDTATREVLDALGLPFVRTQGVASREQAEAAARGAACALAMKVLSDEIVHKSDAGLVLTGVLPDDAGEAYSLLDARRRALGIGTATIVVQPMAPPGLDLLVGCKRDPVFGPLFVVGLGGTTVELLRDVTRRVGVLSAADIHEMLTALRTYPLIAGHRGSPAHDTRELCRMVAALSECVVSIDMIEELDLNPIRLYPDGSVLILDARMTLGAPPPAEPRRHARPLDALLRPGSVAVLGASRTETRPGSQVVRNLVDKGFAGRIHPINPSGGSVGGLQAVARLADLPVPPDHVCIALPADAAVPAVRECVAAGVPAITVLASGFAEAGERGRALEAELVAALGGASTVLCGPNTIGLVSAPHRMALTFSQGLGHQPLTDSGVSLIAQSGAIAGSLVSRELARGYGIGDWVTVGNQADLDAADYLAYLAGRPSTRSIALFLEGVSDGSRLRAALRGARSAGIPVVVFKAGQTEDGAKAAASHSGALAGAAEAYAAVLRQDGAIQVDELTALLETAWVMGRAPRPSGRRVGLVSTSGGAASAATDLLVASGLELARLTETTIAALRRALPEFAHAANPLDLTAEGTFAQSVPHICIAQVAADPGVDIVCVVLTSIAGDDAVRIARQIARAAAATAKPVLVTWLIAPELAAEGMRLLVDAGIRVFDEPARMMRAVGHLAAQRTTTPARPRTAEPRLVEA